MLCVSAQTTDLSTALLIGSFLVAAASPEATAQWTQWGGPTGDFNVTGAKLADTWPSAGPPRVWERLLGDGYSAISVSNGLLYTMYRKAETGETVWEHGYEAPLFEGFQAGFGEGPQSTPLIVGNRVFAVNTVRDSQVST